MKKTRVMIFMALLISMEIVLTRFLSIQTPIVRIGFGFLPIAISGIMFGPVIGGITAAMADALGVLLFPSPAGPYFPGFTLSAFITGAIYGLMLYKKPKTIIRIALAVLLIRVFIDLGLNTLWISIIIKKAWMIIIPTRLIASSIMLPVQTILIYNVWKYIGKYAEKSAFIQQVKDS